MRRMTRGTNKPPELPPGKDLRVRGESRMGGRCVESCGSGTQVMPAMQSPPCFPPSCPIHIPRPVIPRRQGTIAPGDVELPPTPAPRHLLAGDEHRYVRGADAQASVSPRAGLQRDEEQHSCPLFALVGTGGMPDLEGAI